MLKMYYYLIKADRITNINQIAPSYREPVTEYIKQYGWTVDEDGNIDKHKKK